MLYVVIGAAVVASTVAFVWFAKIDRMEDRPEPVVELTEWQAMPTRQLSSTLDTAFTRF